MSSNHEVFGKLDLLTSPKKRAGWSDRTALLMAEMSSLAYCKFEEHEAPKALNQSLLKRVFNWFKYKLPLVHRPRPDAGNLLSQLELSDVYDRLMRLDIGAEENAPQRDDQTENVLTIPPAAIELRAKLHNGGFKLAGLISDENTDTQAFIATTVPDARPNPFGDDKVVVLSFRGTKTPKDWQTNAKFDQKDVRGASVHRGFQNAFEAVRPAICGRLKPLIDDEYTLYVTGHSLGGALAVIATRDLGWDSAGACYTFGQPRVARFGFAEEIKTPIYRVINSNDLVPRVPPAYLITILMILLKILNFPLIGRLRPLIKKWEQYVHHGDMRYLKRTPANDFSNVQVRANPSVVYRTMWYISAFVRDWRSPTKNHDIDLYAAKLAAYADRRLKRPSEIPPGC